MKSNVLKDNLDLLFSNLEKYIKSETVIGEPVIIGEITLVPIISVLFGSGVGVEINDDKKNKNENSSGGGFGGKISPNAVLVIKNDDVTMLPITEKCHLDGIFKVVPDIMNKIKDKKENL